jgi:hypothetical protein
MPEQARNRDCVVLFKGDAYPVAVDDTMAQRGWKGGQGVQWVESSRDEFVVTFSDGYYSGFMLWGSDEIPDRFTASTQNQPAYRFGTCCAGGWLIMTTSFERYTYMSRIGGGPLVPITYHAADRLVFSLRGLFTKEDEWTLSGDPRAPNDYYIAFVSQPPTVDNGYYMTIQISI